MKIRGIRTDELESARMLLVRCGWTKKVEDFDLFASSVENSQIAIVAEYDDKIVGFLRAITDSVFNGYISMVAVEAEFRGRGIGTALVAAAVGSNPNITWVLRADRPGVSKFYESIGFQESLVAMEKKRGAA